MDIQPPLEHVAAQAELENYLKAQAQAVAPEADYQEYLEDLVLLGQRIDTLLQVQDVGDKQGAAQQFIEIVQQIKVLAIDFS